MKNSYRRWNFGSGLWRITKKWHLKVTNCFECRQPPSISCSSLTLNFELRTLKKIAIWFNKRSRRHCKAEKNSISGIVTSIQAFRIIRSTIDRVTCNKKKKKRKRGRLMRRQQTPRTSVDLFSNDLAPIITGYNLPSPRSIGSAI